MALYGENAVGCAAYVERLVAGAAGADVVGVGAGADVEDAEGAAGAVVHSAGHEYFGPGVPGDSVPANSGLANFALSVPGPLREAKVPSVEQAVAKAEVLSFEPPSSRAEGFLS